MASAAVVTDPAANIQLVSKTISNDELDNLGMALAKARINIIDERASALPSLPDEGACRMFTRILAAEEWLVLVSAFLEGRLSAPELKDHPLFIPNVAYGLALNGHPQAHKYASIGIEQHPTQAGSYAAMAIILINDNMYHFANKWLALAKAGLNFASSALAYTESTLNWSFANQNKWTAHLQRRISAAGDIANLPLSDPHKTTLQNFKDTPTQELPLFWAQNVQALHVIGVLLAIPFLPLQPEHQGLSELTRHGASFFHVIAFYLPVNVAVALSGTCRLLFSWLYDNEATYWKNRVQRTVGITDIYVLSYAKTTRIPLGYYEFLRRQYLLTRLLENYIPSWVDPFQRLSHEDEEILTKAIIHRCRLFYFQVRSTVALPDASAFLHLIAMRLLQMDRTSATANWLLKNTRLRPVIVELLSRMTTTTSIVGMSHKILLLMLFAIAPNAALPCGQLSALLSNQTFRTHESHCILDNALCLSIASASRRTHLQYLPCSPDPILQINQSPYRPILWAQIKKEWSQQIWSEFVSHETLVHCISRRIDEGIIRIQFPEEKGMISSFVGFGVDLRGSFEIVDGQLQGPSVAFSVLTYSKVYQDGTRIAFRGTLTAACFAGYTKSESKGDTTTPSTTGTWMWSMTNVIYSEETWSNMLKSLRERAAAVQDVEEEERMYFDPGLRVMRARIREASGLAFRLSNPSFGAYNLQLFADTPPQIQKSIHRLMQYLRVKRGQTESTEDWHLRLKHLSHQLLILMAGRYAFAREYANGTTILQDDIALLDGKDKTQHKAVLLRWSALLCTSIFESYGQLHNASALQDFLKNAAKPFVPRGSISDSMEVLRLRLKPVPSQAPPLSDTPQPHQS